jgi:mono-ADP-ribosyltransferase sirtuin 6
MPSSTYARTQASRHPPPPPPTPCQRLSPQVGFKATGRRCSQAGCAGPLKDHILDWEDALPEDELQASEGHADTAQLAICLGTSLQITPACNIPLRTVKAGGRLAIINLQKTPKDRRAQLVVHARVDGVMALLMQQLGMPIPPYTRQDRLRVRHELLLPGGSKAAARGKAAAAAGGEAGGGEAGGGAGSWGFKVSISSVHGHDCPLPMVKAVTLQLQWPGSGNAAQQRSSAAAELAALLAPVACSGSAPFSHAWQGLPRALQQVQVQLVVQLNEHADEDKRQAVFSYTVKQQQQQQQQADGGKDTAGSAALGAASAGSSAAGGEVFTMTSQVVDYSSRQQQLVAELREQAAVAAAAAEQQGKGAAGGKRKRQAGSAQDAGPAAYARPAVETRPHTTRLGRKTTTVVLRD